MTMGQRIKDARLKAGLTQTELAEKLGISYQSIGQWERDLRNPKYENLQRIAKALGVTTLELTRPDKNRPFLEINFEEIPEIPKEKIPEVVKILSNFLLSSTPQNLQVNLNAAFNKLNSDGQQKAVERVEELTEIPRYQRQPAENAPESTETTLEGKDTTPDETPTETAHNSSEKD